VVGACTNSVNEGHRWERPPKPGQSGIQTGRTNTKNGLYADVDPLMGHRPGPTHHAAGHRRGGLDRHHQLARHLIHTEDPDPGQSQQGLRQTSTVAHRRGLLIVAAFRQAQR